MNDLLSPARRYRAFVHTFALSSSIKDVVESMGVPHTEIDLILLNGTPTDLSHSVNDCDRFALYPAFSGIDISSLQPLRPPLEEYRFVLDMHLGRLARYLRLLGFDCLYQNRADDKELARISHDGQRILLTRDTGLLKRSEVIYGYYTRSTEIRQQVIEVLGRFHLNHAAAPFTRCLECNSLLRPVSKESIIERLEPRTRQNYQEFLICPHCNRIYWAGSHRKRMSEFIGSVLAS